MHRQREDRGDPRLHQAPRGRRERFAEEQNLEKAKALRMMSAGRSIKYGKRVRCGLVVIVIAIMVHVAIALAVLSAVRPSVLRMSPTMVLVILVSIAIPISDGDIAKINSYSRSRYRWKRRGQRDKQKGRCD
jgi:hypothetical protein